MTRQIKFVGVVWHWEIGDHELFSFSIATSSPNSSRSLDSRVQKDPNMGHPYCGIIFCPELSNIASTLHPEAGVLDMSANLRTVQYTSNVRHMKQNYGEVPINTLIDRIKRAARINSRGKCSN